MNIRDFGAMGEDAAKGILVDRGYEILETNYRRAPGEIDIIARKDGLVAFVEVKNRAYARQGRPAEAVTLKKQRCIVRTAMIYAQEHGLDDVPLRFDVIEVLPSGVNHIEGAFDTTGWVD